MNKRLAKFQKKFDGSLVRDKKFPFQEARDCPVCQVEFKSDDKVIKLSCNKLHVYHKNCLQDIISLELIENKCIICRRDIDT